VTGRANQGSSHATSGVCQGSANHRLSVRRRMAKARKGLPAALRCAVFGASRLTPRFYSEPPRRRASTLRVVVHAPRKPWVTIELRVPCYAQAQGVLPCRPVRHICRTHGHPSNACVRPMDGFTPSRNMTSRDHLLWQIHLLQKRLVSRVAMQCAKGGFGFHIG
jgi:hypothetical protein